MKSWLATGTSCTKAMLDYLVAILRSVSDTHTVPQLTGITSAELQEIYNLAKIEPTTVAGKENVPYRAEHTESSGVPGLEQPIWQSLINGSRSLQSNNVALNMLLQRARMNYDKSPDMETAMAGATLLRQFFVRNQSTLKQQMNQLCDQHSGVGIDTGSGQPLTDRYAAIQRWMSEHPLNAPAMESTEASTIPSLDSPKWQLLIKGDLAIKSNAMAFNMLLQRVRMSYRRNPGIETTLAGATLLQQFFMRNQKVLQQEIDQLNNL
jgi:hypothetical protein